MPHLSFLDSVEISETAGQRGTGDRERQHGRARRLPALVSVTERTPEVRFPNFKGILSAKKKPLTVLSLGDLGLAPDAVEWRPLRRAQHRGATDPHRRHEGRSTRETPESNWPNSWPPAT